MEHRENEEYYTVIRRKKESTSRRVPWYLFLVIAYFLYDDIPSPEENYTMFKAVAFLLVLCSIPFALGQGNVMMQMLNSFSDLMGKAVGKVTSKLKR